MPGTEIDDGLTDAEREALKDEDESEATETAEDPPKDEPAETAKTEEKDEDKPAADADKAKTEEADKAQADEAAATAEAAKDEEAKEAPQTSKPILIPQQVEGAETRLAEIAEKKDAILAQFDDGDITAREMQKQLDELSRQERKIEFEQHEAQLAQKLESQRMQNEWSSTCSAFVEQHPIYKDNPRLYQALDREVRDLAGKPDTANWSGQKFLDEAHKALLQAFNLQETGKAAPKAPARELPPNLSKVPAAEVEDTNGGRFAVLDRMANTDPLGYEEALSKMSDKERDAYLAA